MISFKDNYYETSIEISDNIKNIPFFDSLLSGNFSEKDNQTISVHVNNARIACDIIMGIKPKKSWRYIRDRLICENYFGIEPDLIIVDDNQNK